MHLAGTKGVSSSCHLAVCCKGQSAYKYKPHTPSERQSENLVQSSLFVLMQHNSVVVVVVQFSFHSRGLPHAQHSLSRAKGQIMPRKRSKSSNFGPSLRRKRALDFMTFICSPTRFGSSENQRACWGKHSKDHRSHLAKKSLLLERHRFEPHGVFACCKYR